MPAWLSTCAASHLQNGIVSHTAQMLAMAQDEAVPGCRHRCKLPWPTQQVLRWLRLTSRGLRPRRSVMPPAAMTPVPAAFTMPTTIAPRIGDFRPAFENTCAHHHTHETHYFDCGACLQDNRKCVISVAQEQKGQLTLAE